MKRVVIHWTAGTHLASNLDKKHYHFVVTGDGDVVSGDLNPEANLNCNDGIYAAHTRGCNTGAIGVSMCGMHGATERPFSAGSYPLKSGQVDAMVQLVADLCETYKIPIDRTTVLTHSEVQPTLGITQSGKWDVNWLPGMSTPGDPVEVGDDIRARVKRAQRSPVAPVSNPFAAIAALIARIFGR